MFEDRRCNRTSLPLLLNASEQVQIISLTQPSTQVKYKVVRVCKYASRDTLYPLGA